MGLSNPTFSTAFKLRFWRWYVKGCSWAHDEFRRIGDNRKVKEIREWLKIESTPIIIKCKVILLNYDLNKKIYSFK